MAHGGWPVPTAVVAVALLVLTGLISVTVPGAPSVPAEHRGFALRTLVALPGSTGTRGLAAPSGLAGPRWAPLPALVGPPRVPGTLASDPANQGVLWWGVVAGLSATWLFRLGAWSNVTTGSSLAPPPVPGAALFPDPAIPGVVWVGGASPSGASTWAYSNGSWSNLTGLLAGAPPEESYASAVWDSADSEGVLFGGWNSSGYSNRTWTFHAGSWSEAPGRSPTARAESGFAYSPSGGGAVLVGGGTSIGPVNDSWTFAAGAWAGPFGGPPVGAGDASSLVTAPGGNVVAFGGSGCGLPVVGPCNFTYSRSGSSWTQYDAGSAPSPRSGMALAYDASDGEILGWGGGAAALQLNDTWTLGGRVAVTVQVVPPVVGVDEPAEFVAHSAGGYGPLSFTWANGPLDCPTANSATVLCESEIPGNYLLRGTVTDSLGNGTNATAAFTVLARFASTLSITPSITDVGFPVEMSVSLVGGTTVTNYTWTGLPPGCPDSFAAHVNCTSVSPGFFAPVAIVTDALGHVAPTPPVGLVIHDRPAASIGANRSEGPTPCAVGFAALVDGGTAPMNFTWSFGDNTTGTGPTPGHVYGTPGTFGVSVRVVDAVGAVVTGTLNGTIDTFARLVVSPPAPAGSLEVGHAVVYAVDVSGGAPPFAYAWTLGDGSNATGANPSHEYATAGRYTVLVVVSDSRGQVDDGVATIVIAGDGSPSNGALFGDLEAVGLVAAGFAAGVAAYVLFARRKGGRPALRSGPSERDSGPA